MAEEYKPKKKHHWKFIAFLVFLLILGGLWYTSVHPGSFTGNFISSFNSGGNSTIRINADLKVPSLQLDGNFGEVDFRGNSDSYLYVEGEKIKMSSMSNYVALEGYRGKISFDEKKISLLKGTASRVLVNGLPVESASNSNVQVSLDKDFQYIFLNLENASKINKIDYVSSGVISVNNGKNNFDADNNRIILTNFIGAMTIQNGKFRPDGYVQRLDINGGMNLSVS